LKIIAYILIGLGLISLLGFLSGNQPDMTGVANISHGEGRKFGFYIAPLVFLSGGIWILIKSQKKEPSS
jgi:hypothetical protein